MGDVGSRVLIGGVRCSILVCWGSEIGSLLVFEVMGGSVLLFSASLLVWWCDLVGYLVVGWLICVVGGWMLLPSLLVMRTVSFLRFLILLFVLIVTIVYLSEIPTRTIAVENFRTLVCSWVCVEFFIVNNDVFWRLLWFKWSVEHAVNTLCYIR